MCSTYGDGEVPSSAREFYAQPQEGDVDLTGVRFAVFGMGDASYTKTYSRGGELLTEALEARGATRVGEYGRHDASGTVPAGEAACEWAGRSALESDDRTLSCLTRATGRAHSTTAFHEPCPPALCSTPRPQHCNHDRTRTFS